MLAACAQNKQSGIFLLDKKDKIMIHGNIFDRPSYTKNPKNPGWGEIIIESPKNYEDIDTLEFLVPKDKDSYWCIEDDFLEELDAYEKINIQSKNNANQ